MAITPNLLMTKPDVGGSTDTWGDILNDDVIDVIDLIFSLTGTDVSMSDITFATVTSNGLASLASVYIGADGATVTGIKDEDSMVSDSATALATQQSIKKYVDNQVLRYDTLEEVLATGNTTGTTNIIVDVSQKITTDTITETTTDAGVTIELVKFEDGGGVFTGVVEIPNGSVSGPSLAFDGDEHTGFYWIGNDNIGVAAGGSKVIDIGVSSVGITGALTASGNITTSGGIFSGDLEGDVTGDVTGDLDGDVTGDVTGALIGNADTATLASTATVTNTTADSTYYLPLVTAYATGSRSIYVDAGMTYNPSSNTLSASTFTASVAFSGNVSGNVTGSSGSCTGLAATATALAAAVTIGGVSFDGTTAINLPGVNDPGTQDTIGSAASLSATLVATSGGTNLTGYAVGDLVYADTTTSLARLAKETNGQVLTLAGGKPSWASPTVGDITKVTAGSGLTGGGDDGDVTLTVGGTTNRISVGDDAVDIASGYVGQTSITTVGALDTGGSITSGFGSIDVGSSTITTTGAVSGGSFDGDLTGDVIGNADTATLATSATSAASLSATLAVTSGGTGFASYAVGDIVYADTTTSLIKRTAGATGYVLTIAGGVPTWAAPSATTTAPAGTLTGTELNATVVTSSLTEVGVIAAGTWEGTTVAVDQGGTGVTSSTGTTNVVLSHSPTLVTPALGTPSALVLTNATALPAAQVAQGTMASGMVLVAPALGTPASGVMTNVSGTASSLTAGAVTNGVYTTSKISALAATTSAELRTVISDETGTGGLVFADSPTLITPALGIPASGTATNITGLPIGDGTTGTLTYDRGGTGIASYAKGDIVIADDTNSLAKLAAGTNTHVLTLASGVPTWAAPAAASTSAETLTGAYLASNVLASSLTSVGTLTGLTVNGATVFNENGANVDFRIEADGEPAMFVVDATNDKIGIGTETPAGRLEVYMASSGASPHTDFDEFVIESSGHAGISILTGTDKSGGLLFGDSDANDRGKLYYDHNTDKMNVAAGGSIALTLDGSQDVNIPNGGLMIGSTSSPSTALHVTGTLTVTNSASGWATGLYLDNTNADAAPSMITMQRTSASPADLDYIGGILMRGKNDAAEDHAYVEIYGQATDVSNGSESSKLRIGTWGSGTEYDNTLVLNEGKVGIGTASPDAHLEISAGDDAPTIKLSEHDDTNKMLIKFASDVGEITVIPDKPLVFKNNNEGRFRIHTGGSVLFGATSAVVPGSEGMEIKTDEGKFITARVSTSTSTHWSIANGNQEVGSVSTGGYATTFATSSDYRLKENESPFGDALDLLGQLKPYKFNFKTMPDEISQGFFAHEVAEIVPQAVIGEKDAVTDDGSIKSQSIDHSHMVPLLVAAIQELTAKVEALEANN